VAAEASGNGEQSQAQPLWLPPPGGVAGEGEGLHPGDKVGGEGGDRAPDLVGGEVVQREVGQPAVLQAADAVLGTGSAAVPQLQVGELPAGGEGG
jgi:hypothetical protein